MTDRVRAYILIEASAGASNNVLEAVAALPETVRADRVTGPYDVIAVLEAENLDQIGSVIHDKLQALPGITRTMSCLRFEA